MALDGKTLRGSKKPGAPGTPLFAARAHPAGITLAPHAVDDTTHASTAVEPRLGQVVLEGRMVTRAALLTQRPVAQTLVDQGGDEVMLVKAPQPQLRDDIALVCALPPAGDRQEAARTVDLGHGRIAQCHRTTRAALGGDSAWPGLAQGVALGRDGLTPPTTAERVEGVYGGTSLSPARGPPERLLALVRGHWQMENKSPWVREVTCDADRSPLRGGNMPQGMAALRQTAMGLLRGAGYSNMAAACRRFAAQPDLALTLIGIKLE
jgi:predicted transposase YbfD/YdcC